MKLKTAATIADDFAFGYEQIGGFQRVFEDDGGQRRQEAVVAAQHAGLRALYRADPGLATWSCVGLAGSNPIKFVKQAKGLGIKQQLVGGSTTADDTIIGAFGDEVRRPDQHQSLFARHRQRRQQALHRGDAEELRRRRAASATTPRASISTAW